MLLWLEPTLVARSAFMDNVSSQDSICICCFRVVAFVDPALIARFGVGGYIGVFSID